MIMYCLGLDFGTSGARAIAIDRLGQIHHHHSRPYQLDQVQRWQVTLFDLLSHVPLDVRRNLAKILVAATSGTVLGSDRQGQPCTPVLSYQDVRGIGLSPFPAATSLAKLLWLKEHYQFAYLTHQADYLGYLLHGQVAQSDYHNCLKLGYDSVNLRFPDWLSPWQSYLPSVLVPGSPVGQILPDLSDRLHISPTCQICAGTTDSTAALIASAPELHTGIGITSLGSTLVLKLVSDRPVTDLAYGIYSHRLDWQGQSFYLVGGASNTGGAVLRHFFRDQELQTYSELIDLNQPSPYDYYPLLRPGDRFPINDPNLPPRLEPRPNDPVAFLYGLLSSIAKIEAQGYEILQKLAATPITQIYTNGGGTYNPTWQKIRAKYLGIEPQAAVQTQAAYGAAKLALEMNQHRN
ncbi:MAG: FGGY-family carbohydrate kinase [Pseudanabaenaceae cyanobacterium bins.68]|nr:FGGY-family carbohydrate kinase [Pseudanabaenaceae cyanobacterium bins.68]